MEQHLGRYLLPEETVDHIDGNFTNHDFNNMRVIERSKHIVEDVIRKKSTKFVCPMCSKQFSISGNKLHDAIQNRKRGKAGPFCGRKCAGKYGKSVQLGAPKEKIKKIKPEYTTIKTELSL